MSRYQAYAEYKESGVDWLGTIPRDWEVSRIKFFSIVNPSKSEVRDLALDTEVSFLPMEAIGEQGELDITRTKLLSDVINGYTYIGENDVCIAKITPCFENGKGAVVTGLRNGIAFATTEVIPLRCHQIDDSKFLYYLLTSAPFNKQAEGSMYGAGGQKRVADSFVANYHFALPPISTRPHISNFLDHETAKIDTLIEKQQELIKLLKEKRQAVISHAVTKGLNPNAPMRDSGVAWLGEVPEHWDVKCIKHLSQVKRGASPRPIDDPKFFDDDGAYAWVRIADVSSAGMYLTSTTQRLSELGSSLSVKLEPNQLFISIAGTVGKPCLTISKACIHDGFVYFPSLSINNKFIYYIFEAGEAYLGLGKMGTQLNLNTDTVGGIKVGLPPKDEVEAIVDFIEKSTKKYDELVGNANRSVALMLERRTALISAAVTGKIDVRDEKFWQRN